MARAMRWERARPARKTISIKDEEAGPVRRPVSVRGWRPRLPKADHRRAAEDALAEWQARQAKPAS